MSTCVTNLVGNADLPDLNRGGKSEPIDVNAAADRLEDAIATSAVAKHWPDSPAFVICKLEGDTSPGFWMDATPRALHSPLDISIMTMSTGFRWNGYRITKTPGAKLKSLRLAGDWYDTTCYAIGVGGNSVGWKTISKWDENRGTLYCKPIVTTRFKKGADWVDGGDVRIQSGGLTAGRFRLACAIQFNLFYRWRAVIEGLPNRSVMLDGDAVAIREFFSDRDITQGATRRAALRHWVQKHRRRVKCSDSDTADAITWVRKHLRGKTDFQWHGLRARLEVAPAQLQELSIS